MPSQDCAILFAKSPVPGRVKSRLFRQITPEQACRLHCACTNDTLELLENALPAVSKWLLLSEQPHTALESGGITLPAGFRCGVQQGCDLGDRLDAAFRWAFDGGARRVAIFGSDSPTLPSRIVEEAFPILSDVDVVLGPAEDGSDYLVGCRRFIPGLFEAVEWSTTRTLAQTRANAQGLGYRVALLDTWFDIDTWSDVERLMSDLRKGAPLTRHLAAILQEFAV